MRTQHTASHTQVRSVAQRSHTHTHTQHTHTLSHTHTHTHCRTHTHTQSTKRNIHTAQHQHITTHTPQSACDGCLFSCCTSSTWCWWAWPSWCPAVGCSTSTLSCWPGQPPSSSSWCGWPSSRNGCVLHFVLKECKAVEWFFMLALAFFYASLLMGSSFPF